MNLMIFNRRHLLTGALAVAFVPAAPAIVKAATTRRLIYEFGDGNIQKGKSEAAADYRATFTAAAASGSPVEVPPGRYPFRTVSNESCVYVNAETPIDFACAPDANFILGAELNNKKGALFLFQNPNGPIQGTAATFRFTGGYFDGSQITAIPADNSGFGMMSVRQYASPYIANLRGFGGSSDPQVGRFGAGCTDTFVATHGCFKENIVNVWGSGFYDCLLYISGDNQGDVLDGRGEQGTVTGMVATRCGNGIGIKRDYIGLTVVDCSIWHCLNGIIGSQADGMTNNQGKRTSILGGQIGRIQGRPISMFGQDPVVENVTIGDFGVNLVDRRTLTGYTRYNEISAIDLQGCTGGRVVGNVIRTRGVANDTRRGIALRRNSAGDPTTGGTIQRNDISGLPQAQSIFVDPACSGNISDNSLT